MTVLPQSKLTCSYENKVSKKDKKGQLKGQEDQKFMNLIGNEIIDFVVRYGQ